MPAINFKGYENRCYRFQGKISSSRAVAIGNLHIWLLFISKGAAIGVIDSEEKTTLHRAVATRNVDTCQLLFSKGAKVDAKYSCNKRPLLMPVGIILMPERMEQRGPTVTEFR